MHRSLIVSAIAVALTAAVAASTPAVAQDAEKSVVYSAAQAQAGAKVFAENCARCHGDHLEGISTPPLKGPDFVPLKSKDPLLVGDIFRFVTQEMPAGNPGSLSHEEYLEVMAFILRENDNTPGAKPLVFSEALQSRAPIHPAAAASASPAATSGNDAMASE
jgi:polar amino acid transport system substrate-binding protein